MKFSIKLTIAMVMLVAVTAAALGLLTYRDLEKAILPRALERMETHARLVASQFESYARSARADIESLRSADIMNGIQSADLAGNSEPGDDANVASWRARVASRFVVDLGSKIEYSQYSIVGIKNGGREILRVDRGGPNGAVRIVPESKLQSEGDREYFKKSISLKSGELYVSQIHLNEVNDVIVKPYVPTLRLATVIFGTDGRPFGILAISVNMMPALDSVRTSVRPGGDIYLVNARGDYLVHPDARNEFGYDRGQPTHWTEDLPELAGPLGSVDSISRVVRDKTGENGGGALATAWPAGGEPVAVIETVPNAVWMAPAKSVQQSILLVGISAVLCAGMLASLIAQSLTRPLVQMTRAVEGIENGGRIEVFTGANGEVGVLARAFARVVNELKKKIADFEREVEDHRRTQRARENSEQQAQLFRSAVEFSNDAIITRSLDGIVTGWNDAATRVFGFTADEVLGKSIDI